MSVSPPVRPPASRPSVPRGLKPDGPALFSYGFRPFFLGGAIFAALAMSLWLSALITGVEPGGSYGGEHWHAHEMLFGFAPAILAGFLLTAIPNWTGRLPVAGLPLMLLFTLWTLGRLVMIDPDRIGLLPSIVIDSAFLPAMALVALREVVAGRKWKDLKMLVGLGALALANIAFHRAMLTEDHPGMAIRLSIAAYTLLVMVIGGRIIPSFTRNVMAKAGRKDAPVPHGGFDRLALLLGAGALLAWVVDPWGLLTSPMALLAAAVHLIRLARWKGLAVRRDALLLVLHGAYLFVPAGLGAIALGDVLPEATVLHVLTVGVISTMMLAVMTRASRGHTGRALVASKRTICAYGLLFGAGLLRPLADLAGDYQLAVTLVSGLAFVAAFALFGLEHGPMLAAKRRPPLAG